MATIVVDPVTRIEGHLKISVTTDSNNRVTEARATGNMYRGFENLLINREPRDAAFITQRICGVCPVPHGVVSSMAVENAAGFKPTLQAILLRNLMQGANFLGSHILHFYHLAALDYVKGPAGNPWEPGYDEDFRLSPANNQAVLDNYALALTIRRKAQEMRALIGGMFTHVGTVLPGGVMVNLSSSKLETFKKYLDEVEAFICNVYPSDLELVASAYGDYFDMGKGTGDLLSSGVFDTTTQGNALFPAGTITDGVSGNFDPSNIKEYTAGSWYSSPSGENPAVGTTTPQSGKSGAYSWMKSPRYNNRPYEVGPLARVWVSGDYRNGVSVMDRHKARYIESVKIAKNMQLWLSRIVQGENSYTPVNPSSGQGIGLTEAPRGSLGHWISVSGSRITKYQIITPTCWNGSPVDDAGIPGPMEQALVGTKINNTAQPVELLRIIHSYDPCTACSVHMISPKGVEMGNFIVRPSV